MTNQEFYVHLLHRLGSYDDATLLALLIAQGAIEAPLRTTPQKLAEIFLAGTAIDRNRVKRAVSRLQERGLVSTVAQPNRWTEYTVHEQAVRALLSISMPESRFMPGVSQHPIPFLARLDAEPALGAAMGAASPAP
jgi:hypothetical protein